MPSASAAPAVAAMVIDERDREAPRVSIPRPEVHLVVRFGPPTGAGLDIHAMGPQQSVRRKLLPSGQRVVMARLRLGAHEAVLGARAEALAGHIVALDELWGSAATRRLADRLALTRHTVEAAAILEGAIAERMSTADPPSAHAQLALHASERLASASVTAVAADLHVSERHLRRVFREVVGVSPKTFARVTRFRRAVRAAREDRHLNWATIATAAGYYDQAHLIAEFRMIAGVTPRTLLDELRAAESAPSSPLRRSLQTS